MWIAEARSLELCRYGSVVLPFEYHRWLTKLQHIFVEYIEIISTTDAFLSIWPDVLREIASLFNSIHPDVMVVEEADEEIVDDKDSVENAKQSVWWDHPAVRIGGIAAWTAASTATGLGIYDAATAYDQDVATVGVAAASAALGASILSVAASAQGPGRRQWIASAIIVTLCKVRLHIPDAIKTKSVRKLLKQLWKQCAPMFDLADRDQYRNIVNAALSQEEQGWLWIPHGVTTDDPLNFFKGISTYDISTRPKKQAQIRINVDM